MPTFREPADAVLHIGTNSSGTIFGRSEEPVVEVDGIDRATIPLLLDDDFAVPLCRFQDDANQVHTITGPDNDVRSANVPKDTSVSTWATLGAASIIRPSTNNVLIGPSFAPVPWRPTTIVHPIAGQGNGCAGGGLLRPVTCCARLQ